jgi:hypothetical protein
MRYFLLLVFFSLYATCSLAQKPPIDTSVFDKWPSVSTPAISNNGHYVIYTINNQPTGNSTLIIHATRTKWKYREPYPEQSHKTVGRFSLSNPGTASVYSHLRVLLLSISPMFILSGFSSKVVMSA